MSHIPALQVLVYLELQQRLWVALLADCVGVQGVVESAQCLRQVLSVQLVLEMESVQQQQHDQMSPWGFFCICECFLFS